MSGRPTTDVDNAVEELHEEASRQFGSDDFGGEEYRVGLDTYLSALQRDLAIAGPGLAAAARRSAVPALVGRLYAARGWRQHPEYAQVTIERPVFITGIPRSGTTALHQLLANDPKWQGLESWLCSTPMVRPPPDTWDDFAEYRAKVEQARGSAGALRHMHWVDAHEYDECQQFMAQTFVSNTFGSQRSVPSYDRWYLGQNQTPGFHRLADILRLVGSSAPPGTPWLLKNPSHLLSLDALFVAFPDARVVVTHRDPLSAIPSLCSLLWAIRQRRLEPGEPDRDPTLIGRREPAIWSTALERLEVVRADHDDQILDVYQTDVLRSPTVTARSIYSWLGDELDPTIEEAIREWSTANRPGAHGTHRYEPSDFGLDATDLARRFERYRSAFGFAGDTNIPPPEE